MQVGRDETRANALNWVRRGFAAADDGRRSGLHCKDFGVGEFRFQHLRHTRQMATRAHASDQVVNTVGKICQYFLCGGARMRVNVGRVFKLLRHPRVRRLRHQFFGSGNRAVHAFFSRGQVKTCAISQHQAAAFNAHAVGHHQHQFVALHCGHHGQAHARVARCRFNNRCAGLQDAGLFSRLDHGQGNAVFDRTARVAALRLDVNVVRLARLTKQAVDANVWGVANGGEDALGFHWGLLSWEFGLSLFDDLHVMRQNTLILEIFWF